MKYEKKIVLEIESLGFRKCFTLIEKMPFFVANPMIRNRRLVVQEECCNDGGTRPAKREVSWTVKKRWLRQYNLLHKL